MPARLIKAGSLPNGVSPVAFNFVDLQHEASQVVDRARQEAEAILQAARHEAEQLQEQTRVAAREAGLKEFETLVERRAEQLTASRVDEHLLTALPALTTAAEGLKAERDQWLVRWEQTAIRVGVAIAGKLVRTQIAARPELATGMISEALKLAAGQPRVTIHLHPADLAAWGDRAARIIESLTSCADSTLVPDETLSRGGCRIETLHGEIDARVETMLERLANELLEG